MFACRGTPLPSLCALLPLTPPAGGPSPGPSGPAHPGRAQAAADTAALLARVQQLEEDNARWQVVNNTLVARLAAGAAGAAAGVGAGATSGGAGADAVGGSGGGDGVAVGGEVGSEEEVGEEEDAGGVAVDGGNKGPDAPAPKKKPAKGRGRGRKRKHAVGGGGGQ